MSRGLGGGDFGLGPLWKHLEWGLYRYPEPELSLFIRINVRNTMKPSNTLGLRDTYLKSTTPHAYPDPKSRSFRDPFEPPSEECWLSASLQHLFVKDLRVHMDPLQVGG